MPGSSINTYRILISKKAAKELRKLPKQAVKAIAATIDQLSTDPRPDGCKKLEAYLNAYRVRVGNYRIVYSVEDKELLVEVIRVGDRKEIYKKR